MSGADLRFQQTLALVLTGVLLYLPANLIPVMTMTVAGEVTPLTVFGGVEELYHSDLLPAAIVVFLASIVVPFAKLVFLSWILLLHGTDRWRRPRTVGLRVLRAIGSWSMIDLFLLAVLTAVGQLGILASVQPEPGAIFFATVLIATLVAADIYHPKLIWRVPAHEPAR